MGQYSQFKNTLGAPPVKDQRWQDKINLFQTTLNYKNDAAKMAAELIKLRAEKAAIAEREKEVNVKIEAHHQMLVEWLEGAGLTQFKTDDGYTIFIKDEPYSSIEDEKQFLTWIRESGQEELLSVHYQTLNSIAKDHLTAGKPTPPGLKVFIKTGINVRKAS